MTKSQKFKKEYAKELVRIAKGDLETAQVLLESSKGRPENICFHAEQVIEKCLKAVICHFEKEVPFTHNLDILVDRCPEDLSVPEAESLNFLTEYASIRRYEEGIFDLDRNDLSQSVDLANKVYDWANKLVGK